MEDLLCDLQINQMGQRKVAEEIELHLGCVRYGGKYVLEIVF